MMEMFKDITTKTVESQLKVVEVEQAKIQQAKKENEERRRRERLKQLPKPQPMSCKEDIQDYLEFFEANMTDREQPLESWAHHLLPR